MNMNTTNPRLAVGPLILAAMIVLACLSRLLPHPPNFSPIAAVGLFGGAFFASRNLALLVPVLAVVISDVALGYINGGLYGDYVGSTGQLIVLGATVLCTVIGFALRNRKSSVAVATAAVASTAMFFLTTNFGAFLTDPQYPKTVAGLGMAYVAGIPFVKWSLISTLMYSAFLFGGFQLLRSGTPALRAQTV